jgi:DNA-binding IclR family transcriptional regulator
MYQPSMGGRILSFATANGKAWLATLDDAEVRAIAEAEGIGRPSAGAGPKAAASVGALLADLAGVRRRGYALADEEAEPGVAAVAVTVREAAGGPVLGTISVAGPIVRLSPERRAPLAARLADAATQLGRIWPLARPAPDLARAVAGGAGA